MKRKGFTLIELLTVIIILGILATMATSFFRSDYKKQKACAENLEKIHQAIEKYRDDPANNGDYPPDAASGAKSLKRALNNASYIPDANVFKCPADTTGDSYSKFYVRRNDYSNMAAFTLGCPKHEGEKSAMNLFFQGQAMKQKLADVNNGALKPGDTAAGLITFSDGSTANVTQGNVILLQSFDIGAGKCYSLLKIKGKSTTVDCNVTAGSKFEVITPSAIAGVGGTQFRVVVRAGAAPNTVETVVSVTSGAVFFSDRNGKRKREVKAGGQDTEAGEDDDDDDRDGLGGGRQGSGRH